MWLLGFISSVAQSCPTLFNPMDCTTPGLPVHHQLLELTQTHVHWLSDAIQPSHPLSPSSPLPSVFLSIRVFPNKSTLCIKRPNDWNFSISPSNEYTRLISFRTDWFDLLAVHGTLKSILQHHRHQYFGALPSLWSNSPSILDYWKDHCLDYMDLCQQGDVFAF